MRMSAKDYALDRGYGVKTIRRLCRTGKIPYVYAGHAYKVNAEAADAYFTAIEKRTQEEKNPQIVKFGKKKPFLEMLKESQARMRAERRVAT